MQALWISCLFGLCLVPLGVSAKECYNCVPGTSQSDLFCNKPVNKTSCNDDCLTVSYKVKNDQIELSGSLMTCGMGACEVAGIAGCENAKKNQQPGFNLTDCQHKCCSGDLCNDKSLYAGDVSTSAPYTTGSNGVSAKECYECFPGTSQSDLYCNKPVNKTSCNDDCLTLSYTVKSDQIVRQVSGNVMMCGMGDCETTGKTGCENVKKQQQPGFNLTDCQHKCCSGDLCNDKSLYAGDVSTPTTSGETSPRSHDTPTSSGERGVARLCAIFAAFLLSCFQI